MHKGVWIIPIRGMNNPNTSGRAGGTGGGDRKCILIVSSSREQLLPQRKARGQDEKSTAEHAVQRRKLSQSFRAAHKSAYAV